MPAALLAFLLLAATVDARLDESLRLLAEVGARDTTDGGARASDHSSTRGADARPAPPLGRT